MPNPLSRDALAARLTAMNDRPRLWLTVLALLLAVQISPWWYPTPDACGYLSIARSIASGGPVTNLGSPHLWYPPGYPLLLSPTFLLGERPILAISILHWVLGVLCMLGIYAWARRHVPEAAVLLTALALVNVLVWSHFRRTLTELPFMCVMIWTVNALDGVWRLPISRQLVLRLTAGSLLLAYLATIRQVGVMFAAGFGVCLLWQAWLQRVGWARAIAMTLIVGIPASLAVLGIVQYEHQMASLYGGKTYFDNFEAEETSRLAYVLEGMRMRISDTGRIIVPGMFKAYSDAGVWFDFNMVLYLATFALLSLGWWRFVRRTQDILALGFPFYMLLYVAYAMEAGARFLVPVTPLLFVCLWTALEPLKIHRINTMGWLLGLHLVAAVGYWVAVDAPRAYANHQRWGAIDELADTVRQDQRLVQVIDVPLEQRLMLELALDRLVLHPADPDAIDPDAQWIVQPETKPPLDGFARHRVVSGFSLDGRTATAARSDAPRQALRHMGRGDSRRR